MPQPTAALAKRALAQFASPERAVGVARFFKTGKGEYGHGDVFIGCTVPECRLVAREFRALPLAEIEKLLMSRIHEERLVALLIMCAQFGRSRDRRIFQLYRKRMVFVNNWDLVDSSAPEIVGGWLVDKPRGLLDRLAKSKVLWYRRIAIVATHRFIREGEWRDAIRIAERLVNDRHDLIQKAVGWMLREVGKRASAGALDGLLRRHAATMPRTMLRYAIERLTPGERKRWMERSGEALKRRAAERRGGALKRRAAERGEGALKRRAAGRGRDVSSQPPGD
jgi:3-methyladenine DNA glycosylase AlkD